MACKKMAAFGVSTAVVATTVGGTNGAGWRRSITMNTINGQDPAHLVSTLPAPANPAVELMS